MVQTHIDRKTCVVFIFHVNLPPSFPDSQFLVSGELSDSSVVTFVSDGGCGREGKGAGYNDGYERQPEEEERVFRHRCAVSGSEGARVGRTSKLFRWKNGHIDG